MRRGVGLVVLEGNHDRSLAWMARPSPLRRLRRARADVDSKLVVAGWTIAHGHRPAGGSADLGASSSGAPRRRPRRTLFPGAAADRIILPAFSPTPPGSMSSRPRLPEAWRPTPCAAWPARPLACSTSARSRRYPHDDAMTVEKSTRCSLPPVTFVRPSSRRRADTFSIRHH